MRRRRQTNTLLPKMMGVAAVIVAVLVPVLAHFGAFHAGLHLSAPVRVVDLPQPPRPKTPPKPKAKPRTHQAASHAHHAAPHPAQSARPAHANPGPKIQAVAATAKGSGGDGFDNLTNSDQPSPAPPAAPKLPAEIGKSQPAPPPPAVTPSPTPTPAVKPEPPPHDPVLVRAQVVQEIRPAVPDDVQIDSDPPPFWAHFTVHADGTSDVTQDRGTGDARLDRAALDAARQWRFKPATKDGHPVDSFLRLRVNFVVE